MKKSLLTLAAAIPMVLASQAASADTVLTISSWAAPVHTMNKDVFPWMISEMEKCSGGSLSAKVEYGLASPPAQYDTIRDGVADIGWIVYGYTPGKFEATKIVEMPGTQATPSKCQLRSKKHTRSFWLPRKKPRAFRFLPTTCMALVTSTR